MIMSAKAIGRLNRMIPESRRLACTHAATSLGKVSNRRTTQPYTTKATQPKHECFATCHPGLEHIVAAELAKISAENIVVGKAGVAFEGSTSVLYAANLWLRSAIRILQLIHETHLSERRAAGETIYEAFRESSQAVQWSSLLKPGQTFSIQAHAYANSSFTNSMLINTRGRDAICDAIRDARGQRPAPPDKGQCADVPLFVTCFNDKMRIYRDLSGVSLHRRGYRDAMHAASLNEAAAAGCLYLANWDKLFSSSFADAGAASASEHDEVVLADPMCGSGTFLIEAALMASNTAPGLYRKWWPFMHWYDFEEQAWSAAKEEAKASINAQNLDRCIFYGNDAHKGALQLCMRDVQTARLDRWVKLHHGDCREWKLPKKPTLVMSNPPWGRRLSLQRNGGDEEGDETSMSWSALGAFLKREAGGANAYLLSGEAGATQALRMRANKKIPLTVGGVNCRLLEYRVFAEKKEEDGLLFS